MTDEDHIAAVREAVRHLNDAIHAAAQDGLQVDLDTIDISCMAAPVSAIMVTGSVTRVTTREAV